MGGSQAGQGRTGKVGGRQAGLDERQGEGEVAKVKSNRNRIQSHKVKD